VSTGDDLTGDGGAEVFPSRFESFSSAFLSRPLRPPLFIIFSVGSGEGDIGDWNKGEKRAEVGGSEFVAAAIGPSRRGVIILMVGVRGAALEGNVEEKEVC